MQYKRWLSAQTLKSRGILPSIPKQSFEESQNENRLGIAYAHTIVYHLRGVSPRHFSPYRD